MSRSNPQTLNPNPADKWFEWNGEHGHFKYYDKAAEKTVTVPLPFNFILLDELAVVKGWHEPSESGITSNEVRDTRSEPFVVKAFKGGKIADGFWQNIRDRVNNEGGHFTANLYLAYKEDGRLKIGSLQLHGAALSSYFDWRKEVGSKIVDDGDGRKVALRYRDAIQIKKFEEGKKGKITFRFPIFELAPVSPETNAKATELDKQLQEFLTGYFKRTRVEQVDPPSPGEEPQPDAFDKEDAPATSGTVNYPIKSREAKLPPPEDDDVPF